MRSTNEIILNASPITNADVISPAISLDQMFGYAAQAEWTGAILVGTVKLQASLDYNPGLPQTGNHANAGTWSDISGTVQAISGPGSVIWNVYPAMYPYFRAYFTYTSGTGSITVIVRTKGF